MTDRQLLDAAVRNIFTFFDEDKKNSPAFTSCLDWAVWCERDNPLTLESFARGFAYLIRAEYRRLRAERGTTEGTSDD